MLNFARQTAAFRIAVAEAPGLPFSAGMFDVVTAGFVVSHFADYGRGLEDLVRVCRPGGRIGMTSWGAMPNAAVQIWNDLASREVAAERLHDAFRAHVPWEEWFSRPANVVQTLQAAGLASVDVETREYRFEIATRDYLLSREASVQGILLRRASSAERWSDFKLRVADAFQTRFSDTVEYVRDVHFGSGTKPGRSSAGGR